MARSSSESARGIELHQSRPTEKDESNAPLLPPDQISHDFDGESESGDDLSLYSPELDSDLEDGVGGPLRKLKLGSFSTGILWTRKVIGGGRRRIYVFKLPIMATCCFPAISLREIIAVTVGAVLGGLLLFGVLKGFSGNRVQVMPEPAFDALEYVDPLIGTAHGGHVFPGANMPYGMVKAVADCADDNAGGYSTDRQCKVVGFSHMHDSGTGGATSFGNFPLFPQAGCPEDDLQKCHWAYTSRAVGEVPGSAVAKPGYFGIKLENGIAAEMTASYHAALYRFSFPKPNNSELAYSPVIHVDMRDLYGSLTAGSVEVSDNGRMTGWGRFDPSFGPTVWRYAVAGHEEHYNLYFCADFDGKVRRKAVWSGSQALLGMDSMNTTTRPGGPFGAFVQFDAENATDIMARVGISFVSTEQACQNAEKEIPKFNFTRIQDTAEMAWKEKFKNIAVNATGVSTSIQRSFWSGIYRTLLSPQDYTGENPLWKSDEPYFDSFYCIWDSFRSTHPFLTIIDPEAQTLMVRALLDIYKHEGKLPDCRMSLCKGNTQGGSNADVVIADALVKGITEKIDWNLAYEAVVSDAEDEPKDWSKEGRGNLQSWKSLGYIPVDDVDILGEGLSTRSVSRSLEYAYDDYSVAIVAKSLNKTEDYNKYIERSGNWKKLFNPDTKSRVRGMDPGFSGFVQPKKKDGNFSFEDPSLCNPIVGMVRQCYFFQGGFSTYEGGSWLYSFFVPHDQASLIDAMGGKETFVKRLTFFHESGLVDISDEQAFLTVFQYHYAGRPGLSAHRAHAFIPSEFNDKKDGLPGNDDSGSMGSFLAFCMMGFFPNPGQDVYFIIPPFFPEIRLTHPQTKKVAIIRNINFDADYKNHYIQSASLDGKPFTKNWITHDFFTKGGILELTLGPTESSWGTRDEDLPPSLSTSK